MNVEKNIPDSTKPCDPEVEMKNDVFEFVKFQPEIDSASDALLVVAALIFTVTFDRGTDFPDRITEGPVRDIFVAAISCGFSASITMLEFLTNGFPFQRELGIGIYSVGFAYGTGARSHVKGTTATVLLYVAFAIPYLVRAIPRGIENYGCKFTSFVKLHGCG